MRVRRRALLFAALALAVPLPAVALTGGAPAAASLEVSAGLDSCGIAADQVVCKIDATWNEIPGADRYTASVTRADGSVVSFGDVGSGASSFWVPYVGNGTYTVEVSAWGTQPGEDDAKVLSKESATADGAEDDDGVELKGGDASTPAADAGGDDATDGARPEEPEDPPAPCDEADEADEQRGAPEGDTPTGEAGATAQDGLAEDAAASLDGEGELPDEVDCPADHPTP